MNTKENNELIYKKLLHLVADQYLNKNCSRGNLKYGPMEINDFSICFSIDMDNGINTNGVYVKIPKSDLYKKIKKGIIPITAEDRRFARAEYDSLVHLSEHWRSDVTNVDYVKPLAFISEYNAIVTQKVYAKEFFKSYRQWDLYRRLNRNIGIDPIQKHMKSIGETLARFHQISLEKTELLIEKPLSKMKYYWSLVNKHEKHSGFQKKLLSWLDSVNEFGGAMERCNTFKGLDIRNVLLAPSNEIFILDPGRMKLDYKEADLARFLVTCRILYWGSMIFFLRLAPENIYEESFLNGYYGEGKRPYKILAFLIIKELLKLWYLAHIATQLKWWPESLKCFLINNYINPFYRKQITLEIGKFEK